MPKWLRGRATWVDLAIVGAAVAISVSVADEVEVPPLVLGIVVVVLANVILALRSAH